MLHIGYFQGSHVDYLIKFLGQKVKVFLPSVGFHIAQHINKPFMLHHQNLLLIVNKIIKQL